MVPIRFINHKVVAEEAEALLYRFNPKLLENAQTVKTDLLLDFLSDTQGLSFETTSIDSLNGEPIAGQYWPTEHLIEINSLYYESEDIVKRRISHFTEGHEIGHAILHRRYFYQDKRQQCLFEDVDQNVERKQDKLITLQRTIESENLQQLKMDEDELAMERQANAFSAALLIPQKPLFKCVCEMFGASEYKFKKNQYEEFKKTLDNVARRLNDIFDVNPIVMRIRLQRLKIVYIDEGSLFW